MMFFLSLFVIVLYTSTIGAKPIIGTNLGGWMVLEPWITPSLFYRFLDKHPMNFAADSYTFCKVLGPKEGNAVLREHWDEFYTEQSIKDLADRGVEMVRLPVGDWTLAPYGPYIGCMDGAAEKIDWMFDTCAKYNISILLDVHAMKDSQNGFDNSGETKDLVWYDNLHFSHWPTAQANWLGYWNIALSYYENTNWENVNASIIMCEGLIKRWGNHPAFAAFEPVNEPWWNSDIDVLKSYYRSVRDTLRRYNPSAFFVFHNAFVYNADTWNDLFPDDDMDLVVMDHHYYQAWNQGMTTTQQFCDDYENNAAYAASIKYDVWFGEWSLATDVCATWLGGLNDGNTIPQFQCQWVDCPKTYMSSLGTDFDRSATIIGPYGTGEPMYTCIQSGKCPIDSDFFSVEQVGEIAQCALDAFDRHLQGTFFWTAHNELEPRWSYVQAWDKGWLQSNQDNSSIRTKKLESVAPPRFCMRGWCSDSQ